MRPVDLRYRFIYKPLIFAACLVPFLGIVGGILRGTGVAPVPGFNLGVDPVQQTLYSFGKTTLNLLLITLCVSPLRQLTHNANLLRLRRMLGLFAFFYALMHFLTYVGPFEGFSWGAITADIVKRPYITIGFAALVMLVPLAVTSTKGMMRRLGRRWQKLHWLIYPIAILGAWHYWWSVKQDIREPAVYALMVAVLLGWRIWRRFLRMARRPKAARAGGAPPAVAPVRQSTLAEAGGPRAAGSTSRSSLPRAREKA